MKLKKTLTLFALTLSTITPLITPLSQPVQAAVQNGFENNQYYQNGKKSTATGFVKGKVDWWYIKKGKVDYTTTDFITGTVNKENGIYYVHKNKVKGRAVTVDTSNMYMFRKEDSMLR